MADYLNTIVKVLYEAGENGLRLRLLSRHVFNDVNSLFEPVDREDVHDFVARYVPAHAKDSTSMFERCSHGIYRLNFNCLGTRLILSELGLLPADAVSSELGNDTLPATLYLFTDDDF